MTEGCIVFGLISILVLSLLSRATLLLFNLVRFEVVQSSKRLIFIQSEWLHTNRQAMILISLLFLVFFMLKLHEVVTWGRRRHLKVFAMVDDKVFLTNE